MHAASLPPLLLSYGVSPSAVPTTSDPNHPVTANLTLSVTNGTGQAVKCAAIAFVLPVGTGAGDLTATPGAIMAAPAAGTTWTIVPDAQSPGSFTAAPSGDVTLAPNASLSFELSGVLVNGTAGLVSLALYEASDFASAAAAAPTRRQGSLLLNKVNTGLAVTNFLASSWSVTAGQPCVLSWQTTAADTCILSWNGENQAVSTSGTRTVHPTLTTPYTLTASGGGGSVTSQITVSVPVQVSFTGPTESIKIGGPATLNWQISGAMTGTLSPVELGQDPTIVPKAGSLVVNPTETTTYTLTAGSPGGGTVTQAVTVVVDPIPKVESLTFSPCNAVFPGSEVTLSWQTNGLKATIDQGVGAVPTSGSLVVKPTVTTTYTLTCENHNGTVTDQLTVPVGSVLFTNGPSSDGSGNKSLYFLAQDQVRYELASCLGPNDYLITGELSPGVAVVEIQLSPALQALYAQYLVPPFLPLFFDAEGRRTGKTLEDYIPMWPGTPAPHVDANLTQIRYLWTTPDPWSSPTDLGWRFTGAAQGTLVSSALPGIGLPVPPTGHGPFSGQTTFTLTVKGADGKAATATATFPLPPLSLASAADAEQASLVPRAADGEEAPPLDAESLAQLRAGKERS